MHFGHSKADPRITEAQEREAEAAMADPWRAYQAAQRMVDDCGYDRIAAILDGDQRREAFCRRNQAHWLTVADRYRRQLAGRVCRP